MIENILKSYLKNLIYLSIIINLFTLSCKTVDTLYLNKKNHLLDNPIFFKENIEISLEITSLNHLIKNKDNLSEDEWTLYAIFFFQQNEISYAEYCFIEAVSQSNLMKSPYPLKLNNTLKYYLNLLFFYELLKINTDHKYLEKRNEYLKQYVDLIQNREDLAIVTIHEIRKRNFNKLEEDFVEQYYQLRENHTEPFLYEYILTHLQNHKIDNKNLKNYFKIMNQISNRTVKESLLQQLAYYFYYKKDYENYIGIYEKNQNVFKSKIDSSSNIFYVELLFIAYVDLYKKKFLPVPDDIYNKIIEIKYVNETTYRTFLEYYYLEKLLFSKSLDYKKIKIKQSCQEPSFFFFTCPYIYTIKEITIQKEIFGTYDIDKINQIKDFIINFY